MHAHKVLCMRCTYFRAMLTGEMKESRAKTITLPDVRRPIFLALLEYLYTDEVRNHVHMYRCGCRVLTGLPLRIQGTSYLAAAV